MMIRKIQYNSPVVLTFVAISFCTLLLNELTNGLTNQLFFSVYRSSLLKPLTYFRLFGHVLGHVNWEHYVSNMMYILLLGPMLEERYGGKNLIFMFGIVAVTTGILNMMFFSTGLLGASGIVFMMIILSSIVSTQQGNIPLTLILVALLFIGQEVITGATMKDHISQFAHIIGGLCGGIIGFSFRNNRS